MQQGDFKTYGQQAIAVITENPYRLARDVHGIGFRTADQLASRLDIEKTAMIRVRAGISFGLVEATSDGHCGLPVAELTRITAKLLDVEPRLSETALALGLQEGEVIADSVNGHRCVFLAGLHRAELNIAERLRRLSSGRPVWPAIDVAKAIPWVESKVGFELAQSQCEALGLALSSKVLVITGGPGVGARHGYTMRFAVPGLIRAIRIKAGNAM